MLVSACATNGGDQVSPEQACNSMASALCERIYACYTPEELAAASYPASEAACETMLEASEGCTAETEQNACTGNAKYDSSEAAKCSDQITGLTCSQIRDPLFDEQTDAPACALVCAIET
ncbi:MAG TPA: hypothetical protein VMJ10_31795 [Kofleriaceae bacterium]|nr:hypothetical protein [Kofleriaceae bacterium]